MNTINWLEVFNSATTFGLLAVIAIGVMILVSKKSSESHTQKHR